MLPLVSPKKKVNGERKGDRETGHGRRDGYEEADDWNEYKRDRENDHRHRHRHRHLHHQRRQRGVREEDDHPPALAGMPSPPKLEKLRSRFHEEDGSLSDNFAGGDGRHGKENVGSHHYALGQSLPNHHQDGKSTDGGGGGGSPRSKPRSIERMESLPPRLVNQGGYTTTTGADEKADTSTAPPPLPSAAPEISTTSSTTMYREGESYLTCTTSSFEDEDTKQLFNPLQLTLDESIKDEDDSIIGVLDLGPRMPEPIDIIVDVKANCSSRLTLSVEPSTPLRNVCQKICNKLGCQWFKVKFLTEKKGNEIRIDGQDTSPASTLEYDVDKGGARLIKVEYIE